MPTARTDLRAASLDGRVYAVGGSKMIASPHPGSALVEEYTPPEDVAGPRP